MGEGRSADQSTQWGRTAGCGRYHRKWLEGWGAHSVGQTVMIKLREWPWGQMTEQVGGQDHCRKANRRIEGPSGTKKELNW